DDGFDPSVPWKMVPKGGLGVVKLVGGPKHRLSLVEPGSSSASLNASIRLDKTLGDGSRVIDIHGDDEGKAILIAKDPQSSAALASDARMEIDVLDSAEVRIKFYSLSDMAGHSSKRPPAQTAQLISEANLIHGLQDNVNLRSVATGSMAITAPGNLGDPALGSDVLTAIRQLFQAGRLHRCDADLHVFLIWEVERDIKNVKARQNVSLAITFAADNVVLFEDRRIV